MAHTSLSKEPGALWVELVMSWCCDTMSECGAGGGCMYVFWVSLNVWSTVQAGIYFCLPPWESGFLSAPPTIPKGALSGLESHTFRSSLPVTAVITVCIEASCGSFYLAAQTIGWLRVRSSSLQLPQPLTDTICTSSIYAWPVYFLSTMNL